MGESAGRAASLVLDRGADFTAEATTAVLTISSTYHFFYGTRAIAPCQPSSHEIIVGLTGMLPVKNAWHGIDLTALLPCMNNRLQLAVVAAAESISLQLPELDTTAEDIYLRGIYGQQRLQASIMWNGQLRIIFDSLNVTFTPVWANPLWQGLGWPYDTEREQILSSLRETSMALPSRHISWDLTQKNFTTAYCGLA